MGNPPLPGGMLEPGERALMPEEERHNTGNQAKGKPGKTFFDHGQMLPKMLLNRC